MLPLSVLSAVLCDDARVERSGKYLLIGVYIGSVIVPDFPANVVLTLWIEVEPTIEGEHKGEIRIRNSEDQSILLRGQTEFKFHNRDTACVVLAGMPLEFQKQGQFQIEWKFENDTDWSIIRTFVVKQFKG